MVARECSYVHGLYQTFDEILVNAADNVQRNKGVLLPCACSVCSVPAFWLTAAAQVAPR